MRGRIVLGVCGGIAAYKAVEVMRTLQKAGCEVRVIMTRNASALVNPRTFAVLSGFPVEVDQWQSEATPGVDHVAVSHWADLLLIAPATANILGKMAAGIADDALSTYCLAHRREVLVAPAMNTFMWEHPATRRNLGILGERGVEIVEPGAGELACGDVGAGRLALAADIAGRALEMLPGRGPLAGLRILVTAGPTRERIDLVRVISNRSSGRMGVALAAEAQRLGADVTLLHGPLAVPTPPGVATVKVESAAEMKRALEELIPDVDAALLAAAVADLRPAEPADGKLDRRSGPVEVQLEPVEDLAAAIGARDERPYLVVFAAEEGSDRERALAKMAAKGADAVVLNDISSPGTGMEAEENEVWIAEAGGRSWHVPRADKPEVARQILLALASGIIAERGS